MGKNQNAIFCDCCNLWHHLRCSGLTKKEFELIGEINELWFCKTCTREIFPFSNLDTKTFLKLYPNKYENNNTQGGTPWCKICDKKINHTQ